MKMFKSAAFRKVLAISLIGSIAMWAGFLWVNTSWNGDTMLAAIVVFAVLAALCMVPITALAYRDAKAGIDDFVKKLRDDGRGFFKIFAVMGLLCIGASIAVDSFDGGIWLFELGMWVEALDAWVRGYITMIGFWFAPRGYKGI